MGCVEQVAELGQRGLVVVVVMGWGAEQGEEPSPGQPSLDGNHRVSARLP